MSCSIRRLLEVEGLRYRAFLAWRDNEFFEAARRTSRRRAFEDAPERFFEIAFFLARRPRLTSAAACSWSLPTSSLWRGGRSFTPSRRALERPIACLSSARHACRNERAQSLSGRTPAWVDGALPSRLALRDLLRVCFSGIMHLQPILPCQTMIVMGMRLIQSSFLSHPDLRST
jgi:hypothetical protein